MLTFMFNNVHECILLNYRPCKDFEGFIPKGWREMIILSTFGWLFIFTKLKICSPKHKSHVWKIIMWKNIKLFMKSYVNVFAILILNQSINEQTCVHVKKSPPYMNYHNLEYSFFSHLNLFYVNFIFGL